MIDSSTWRPWGLTNPPVGTIVHVLSMAHLCTRDHGDFDPIPGGIFGEIVDPPDSQGRSQRSGFQGHIQILTIARSATELEAYSEWEWDGMFPYHLRAKCEDNGMRFERVPEEIQDAVRAFVALNVRDDNEPIIVDDGWLC